ncbi:MAG: hypothetical protein TREMPRED_003557 [Tremellales sp. Tagirdzhanova-0007]|nr:MAG: hypothetical protein TREMPRED_003557 [Tremellales sp. Tagirdzhanova-0007]
MPATHPFLTDQTPFLLGKSSNPSINSTSSASSSISNTHISTSTIHFHATPPSVMSRTSSSTSAASSASTSSTASPSDFECFQFMSTTASSAHVFGSVAIRGSLITAEERSLWRQTMAQDKGKKEKKARRFGRLF